MSHVAVRAINGVGIMLLGALVLQKSVRIAQTSAPATRT
jgi:hypothetical protein